MFHAAAIIGFRIAQGVDDASAYVSRYGSKFSVIATEVNGTSYERLTLHSIRNNTQPGDRILCALLCRGHEQQKHGLCVVPGVSAGRCGTSAAMQLTPLMANSATLV